MKNETPTRPGHYRCVEHGITRAKWQPDPRMRAFGHFICAKCSRLNFKAWEVLHKKENRARASAWYYANRKAVLARQKAKREAMKVAA